MIVFNIEEIIAYCGQSSYDKGLKCASGFSQVFIQDKALFGLYQGSVGTYRVNIVFEKNIPEYAWCTCPAMSEYYGEKCKHIAAILILWNKSAREFTVLDSWESLLQNKSKEDLLKFIREASQKSIDATSAFHEVLQGEPLIHYEDMYEW